MSNGSNSITRLCIEKCSLKIVRDQLATDEPDRASFAREQAYDSADMGTLIGHCSPLHTA